MNFLRFYLSKSCFILPSFFNFYFLNYYFIFKLIIISLYPIWFCINFRYTVIRQSYTLQRVSLVFPVPNLVAIHGYYNIFYCFSDAVFTSLLLFCNYWSVFHLFTQSHNPSSLWQPSVCSLCLWVCFCLLDFLYCSLDSTCK